MSSAARSAHRPRAGASPEARARSETARIEAEWSDSIACERDVRLSACVHGALVVMAGAIAWAEISVVRLICG